MKRNASLLALPILAAGGLLLGQLATTTEPRVPRIGVLTDLTWKDLNASAFLSSFQQGLRDLG